MPRNACGTLDWNDKLGRNSLRFMDPVPHGWLGNANGASQRGLPPCRFNGALKSFIGHRMDYSQAYRSVNRQSFVSSNRQFYRNENMKTLPERMAARMKELDITQSALARMVGVSQPTVSAIFHGGTQRSKYLRSIAIALETTEAWLLGETEDPNLGATSSADSDILAEKLGLTLVPEFDEGYAMGAGSFLDVSERTGSRAFDTNWLRSISEGNLAKIFVARGDGDSMEPTLHDGDIVLIDGAQNRINKAERIWAVMYGGLRLIKRVRSLPGDQFELMSDNPNVRSILIPKDEMHVVGRVIWIGRKV